MENLNEGYIVGDVSIGDDVTVTLDSGESITGKVMDIQDYVTLQDENGNRIYLCKPLELKKISNETLHIQQAKDASKGKNKQKVKKHMKQDMSKKKDGGLKILGYIDLTRFDQKSRKNSKAKDGQTTTPLTTESRLSLRPLGRIVRLWDELGLILDYKYDEKILFNAKDVIGSFSDLHIDDEVMFDYSNIDDSSSYLRYTGVTGVTNILIVENLLAKARTLIEDGDGIEARFLLEYILSQYPHYQDALALFDANFTKEKAIRPSIVFSTNTMAGIPLSLPQMTESDCEKVQSQLDSLCRGGCSREELLQVIYAILGKWCPTRKCLLNFLDIIVFLEYKLGHLQEATDALAKLIFCLEFHNVKAKSKASFYNFLGSLLAKQCQYEEAAKAYGFALYLDPSDREYLIKKNRMLSKAGKNKI